MIGQSPYPKAHYTYINIIICPHSWCLGPQTCIRLYKHVTVWGSMSVWLGLHILECVRLGEPMIQRPFRPVSRRECMGSIYKEQARGLVTIMTGQHGSMILCLPQTSCLCKVKRRFAGLMPCSSMSHVRFFDRPIFRPHESSHSGHRRSPSDSPAPFGSQRVPVISRSPLARPGPYEDHTLPPLHRSARIAGAGEVGQAAGSPELVRLLSSWRLEWVMMWRSSGPRCGEVNIP